jgi:hypothetical protein
VTLVTITGAKSQYCELYISFLERIAVFGMVFVNHSIRNINVVFIISSYFLTFSTDWCILFIDWEPACARRARARPGGTENEWEGYQ